VFDGASTPHIVRERREKSIFRRLTGQPGEKFELVGVAYLRGIMHGEVDRLGLDSHDILLV